MVSEWWAAGEWPVGGRSGVANQPPPPKFNLPLRVSGGRAITVTGEAIRDVSACGEGARLNAVTSRHGDFVYVTNGCILLTW